MNLGMEIFSLFILCSLLQQNKTKQPNSPFWIELLKELLTLGRGNSCVLIS